MRFLVLLAAALTLAGPAAAQTTSDQMTFDVYLGGIRAGVMGVSGVTDGSRYSAAAKIRTSGLVGLVRDAGYDARSSGTVVNGRFVPTRYEEETDTGSRANSAAMEYVNGVPQLKVYDPPQEPRARDVDPATQGGTLDPMTTIYALLRDLPESEVCTLNVFMFDGRRRSQVVSNGPAKQGNTIECKGEYRRIAGFSSREMADRTVFPFEMRYERNGAGRYSVERFEFQTLLGKAIFRRR